MNPSYKPLVQLVIGFLDIRDRSELEIRQYLTKKTADQAVIDQVISYLIDHNLINDRNFGLAWAESRVRRQKGDIQIIRELTQKGLSKESVHQIVDAIDSADWFSAMELLVSKKAAKYSKLNPYQQKAKNYQLLAQHGYSSKLIDAFLRHKVE